MSHRCLSLLLATACLTACGDSSTEPEAHEPITVIAGAEATDTVGAQLLQALVVQVRDPQQRLAVGAVVRFETTPVDASQASKGYRAYVSPLDQRLPDIFAVDSTDDGGKARVLVSFGTKAGPASVIVTVPELGLIDTVEYTVLPGNAVEVTASPHDTTIYVGDHFTLRSAIVDRFQNPREGNMTFRVVGSAIKMDGAVVTGVVSGSGKLIVSADSLADTASVSVIPETSIAAIMGRDIVTFNSDGSGYRVLATVPTSENPPYTADWLQSGNGVVFDHAGGGPLSTVDLAGSLRVATAIDEWGLYPETSPDGAWIYYSRNTGSWRLYRIHPDGTGEEAVRMNTPLEDVAPSVSPDGKQLVYVIVGGYGSDRLMLLDLSTGVSTDLHINGHSPAWSPSGDLIAFVTPAGLQVVTPTGTGLRTIGASSNSYDFGIDWSPDGQWVIARNATRNQLELINAQSGAIVPLTFTNGFRGPTWKP